MKSQKFFQKSDIYIIIVLLLLAGIFYFGWYKRGERILHSLEADEIESVNYYFYTGGAPPNDSYETYLSREEITRLVEVFHRTKLGRSLSRDVSDGAFSVYTINMKHGKQITVYPGYIFKVNGAKYRLLNKEIWKDYNKLHTNSSFPYKNTDHRALAYECPVPFRDRIQGPQPRLSA